MARLTILRGRWFQKYAMITLVLINAVIIVMKMWLVKGHHIVDALLELHLRQIRNWVQFRVHQIRILALLVVELHNRKLLLTNYLSNAIYRLDRQVDLLHWGVLLKDTTLAH